MKSLRYFNLLSVILFSTVLPVSAAFSATVADWQWLKDSYWYVPKTNLPALRFNALNGTVSPVFDQTVFHISDYVDGYFWGKTVVKLGQGSARCMSLVGSVTPEGNVLLTFTPTDVSADSAVTQGIGRMLQKAKQGSGPCKIRCLPVPHYCRSVIGLTWRKPVRVSRAGYRCPVLGNRWRLFWLSVRMVRKGKCGKN